jgi:hypothetical protein
MAAAGEGEVVASRQQGSHVFGDLKTESGGIESATCEWTAASADKAFFVAGRAYKVLGIRARVDVAGTDAGAVTAVVRKVPSGTAVASGVALHTGTVNLKGSANTVQQMTLSATEADLLVAAGDSLGADFTGVLTAATGAVTVLLAPR